jgi:hypothetical protein
MFIEQRRRAKQWFLQWKGAKKRNSKKPTQMVLFIELNELTCHGPAFEHRPCVRMHRLSVVERAPHDRPQITVRPGRVRRGLTGLCSTLALRATTFAFQHRPCVRTHIRNFFSSLHVHFAHLIQI